MHSNNNLFGIILISFLCFFFFGSPMQASAGQLNQDKTGIYNILDYGADMDTTKIQSPAINAAIEECSKNGGGKVIVPAGRYMCGTIFMKNNVELVLMPGSYIFGSRRYEDFPMQPQNHYRSQKDKGGWNSLIFAADAHDIAVTGSGTIDGRGHGLTGYLKDVPGDGNGRPKNIIFISCKNVRVSGITMLNSALWNQHYLNCEDVMVDHIHVFNHCNNNNDGIDIDGCRRFILSDSIIDSEDDGVVCKSTGPAACENIIIRGCIISSLANGIKCGTESTGGFHNILISDCIIKPSRTTSNLGIFGSRKGISGISLQIVDGGTMDGVSINNIQIEGTQSPLYIRLGNRARKYIPEQPDPSVGTLKNIFISNVTARYAGTMGCQISGIPGYYVENVRINNFYVLTEGGLEKGAYKSQNPNQKSKYKDTYWRTAKEVPESEKSYPEANSLGNLPAFGLFIRHARNIELNNVKFESIKEDPRKAIVKYDVK